MKLRVLFLFLAVMIMISACSKKSAPPQMPYKKGSVEYEFLSTIKSKSLLVDPAKNTELVSTKEFSIYTSDVIPFVFPQLHRYESNLEQLETRFIEDEMISKAKFMARKRMLVNEAKDKNITIEQSTIDSVLQVNYKTRKSEADFYKELQDKGISKEFYLKDTKESLIIEKYLDQHLFAKIPEPTEQDLMNVYNEDKTVSFQQLLLKTNGKSEKEKKETFNKINDLLDRVKKGEDFTLLVKEYSEDIRSKDKGGIYTNLSRGILEQDFAKVAFSVPVGELSDVFETKQGFHFIKVIEKKKESKSFDIVKNRLERIVKTRFRTDAENELWQQLENKYDFKVLIEEK